MDISLLKSLISNSREAIGISDPDGKHVFQNPAFTEMFGYKLQEFNKIPISNIFNSLEEKDKVFSTIKNGNFITKTINMVNKYGEVFLVNLRANAIFDNNNKIVGLIGNHFKITSNLEQTAQFYKIILDNLNIQAWSMVNNRTYGIANRLHAEFMGLSDNSIFFKDIYSIHPNNVADNLNMVYSESFKLQKPVFSEINLRNYLGQDKSIRVVITPIVDLNGNTEKLVCFSNSLSNKFERSELNQFNGIYLRKIYNKLVDRTENELSSLSRELHDNISQRLSILIMKINSCMQKLPEDYVLASKENLDDILKEASKLNLEISQLSRSIHPTAINDFGLESAIKSILYSFSKAFGIKFDISIDALPAKINYEIKLCIFRLIQEALTNIHKHSKASKAKIFLYSNENNIYATILDNGIGFIPNFNGNCQKSLGLLSMRERLYAVNGSLSVLSEPNKGTRIICRIPYNNDMET